MQDQQQMSGIPQRLQRIEQPQHRPHIAHITFPLLNAEKFREEPKTR